MNARLADLKENGQDFEWYPTTDEIIAVVANDISNMEHYDIPSSIMDIGAGDGRVLVAIQKKLQETRNWVDLYAIEKSTIHQANMPKEINVVGTDLLMQTLVDKPVGAVFCNPPYSCFKDWAVRIIREASTKFVYLVIPRRWRDDVEIERAINARDGRVKSLGEFDFQGADREARCHVELFRVSFSYADQDAFDSVLESMLPELDVFDREPVQEVDIEEEIRRELVEGGNGIIGSMVNAYDAELMKLVDNYRNALQLDMDILRELGVTKKSVLQGIRLRIKGLKDKYWRALFDFMGEVKNRLCTKQRDAFLKSISEKMTIDFTEGNILAILVWIGKWANDYYDDQLVELFRRLSADCNIDRYKSNQRTWKQGDWYYRDHDSNKASHYRLEYRLVVSCGGICTSEYNWQRDRLRGLTESAFDILQDIVTVANNLGFTCSDSPGNYEWKSNKQNVIRLEDGSPLVAVRAFKNGNLHIHFDPRVMLAINVEAGRLLGWIRNPAEACDELKTNKKESEQVYEAFNSSFQIGASDNILKICN